MLHFITLRVTYVTFINLCLDYRLENNYMQVLNYHHLLILFRFCGHFKLFTYQNILLTDVGYGSFSSQLSQVMLYNVTCIME